MDDGIKRRPVWILVMGAPSAVSALVVGLVAGAPPGQALALALTFGAVLGTGSFVLNKAIANRQRGRDEGRGGAGRD